LPGKGSPKRDKGKVCPFGRKVIESKLKYGFGCPKSASRKECEDILCNTLIILTGCAESQTAQAVSRLSAAVCALQSKVLPEQLHMDFGYAYAGTLESEEQFLQMVETADARMYQTKRERARHKTDAREKPQGRDEHAEN
jgi:hypothetical protein